MAEYELIQERNISGVGVLRVPSESIKRRHAVLYCSLLRPAKSPYGNFNWNPPRSKFAFLTFLRNGYVIDTGSVEFSKQSFDSIADITSQNLIAIKCAYAGVLQSFINLATGAGLPVIQVTDLIKDYNYLSLGWDEVRVACYADTALNLRLYALGHDVCDPLKDDPQKPPKPPVPPPLIPPGTPIEGIDPPYEDESDPDNVTAPFPGDGAPPPTDEPPGETCEVYQFDLWVANANQPLAYFNTYQAYAPIEISFPNNEQDTGVTLICRGSTAPTGILPEQCGSTVNHTLGFFVQLQNAEIRNFTKVE